MNLKKLTYSAMLICMGILLPFITASNMQLGNMFCLMHIPILLCGFVCGWQWGAAAGIITPLLRHLVFSAPPMPTAGFMALELCGYGMLCGLFYKLLPKKNGYIYISLMLSMLGGRVINGIVQFAFFGIQGGRFAFDTFIISSFVTALPGIALQIVVIPILVMALKRTKLFLNK